MKVAECWADTIKLEQQHLPSPALPVGLKNVEQRRWRSSLALGVLSSPLCLSTEEPLGFSLPYLQ